MASVRPYFPFKPPYNVEPVKPSKYRITVGFTNLAMRKRDRRCRKNVVWVVADMKMIYNLVSNADRKASSTAEVRVHPNSDIALSNLYLLPQQTQTIESISGHTYIRKRISLTLFVKRLILQSKGLLKGLLGNLTYFIYRAVTFLNKIKLHPYNSYYLRNTIKLIRGNSSIINKYIYPISPSNIK